MSRKQSEVRVYTEKDFKQANRLEKIYMHMQYPDKFVLNNQDFDYYQNLITCFHVMTENVTDREVMKKLKALLPYRADATLLSVVNDCENLFGRIRKVNKDFQKMIIRERLKEVIEFLRPDDVDKGLVLPEKIELDENGDPKIEKPFKMRPKNWMDLYLQAEQMLIDLDKLSENDTVETFDWASLEIPGVEFTSDPKFLNHVTDVEEE